MLDIIILIFLLIGMGRGYKKGVVRSLFHLASNIIALYVTIKSYKILASFLDNSFNAVAKIHLFLLSKLPAFLENGHLTPVEGGGMQVLLEKIEDMLLPDVVKGNLFLESFNMSKMTDLLPLGTIGEVMTLVVAKMVFNALVFAFLWFVVNRLVLIIANLISNVLDNLFLMGFVNRLIGLGCGFILYSLVIMVFAGFNQVFFEMTKIAEPSLIADSFFLGYFEGAYRIFLSKIITFI